MALYKNAHANGGLQMPVPMGSEMVVERMTYDATAALSSGDIIEMGILPGDCVPVDLIIDTDDMGTTGTVSFGILNAGKTDLNGSAWTTDANVNTAATGLRADAAGLLAMSRVAKNGGDRAIGLKLTAATTATSGTIGVTLMYRASR